MSDPSTSTTPRTPPAISPFSTSASTLSEPTSDELPDLGAFSTVLREWSHLRAPPRIPAIPQSSSSSSRTYGRGSDAESTFGRCTGSASTSTRQPGSLPIARSDASISTRRPSNSTTDFDFDRETVAGTRSASGTVLDAEGSTVWNQPRIANYLELESGTPTTERTNPFTYDEDEDEDGQVFEFTSPPPSPALSEDARTIEIASELDGGDTRVDSVSLDECGEVAHEVPLASTEDPLNSINGSSTSQEEEEDDDLVTPREVSVVSRASRHSSSTTSRNAPASFITTPSLLSYRNPTTVLSSLSRPSHPSHPSSSHSHHSASSGSDPRTSSSTSRVPPSSFSLLSYRLPESEPSPAPELRLGASDSHASSFAAHLNERGLHPRLDDRSPAADPSSPIPSFDTRPDPVPDISPTPPTNLSQASSRLTTTSHLTSASASGSTSIDMRSSSQSYPSTGVLQPSSSTTATTSVASASASAASSAHFRSASSGDSQHSLSTTPSVLPNPHSPDFLSVATLRLPRHTEHDPAGASSSYVVPLHDHHDFAGFNIIPVHDPPSLSFSSGSAGVFPSGSSAPFSGGNSVPYVDNPSAPLPSAASARFPSGVSAFFAHDTDYPVALDPDSAVFLHALAPATDDVSQQPSLGYLDEALSFIAAERTKWMEQRETGVGQQQPDSAWRHVIEPRRKRRRKRPLKSASSTMGATTPLGDVQATNGPDDDDDEIDEEGNPAGDAGEGDVTLGSSSSPSKSKKKKEKKKKAKARSAAAAEGFKLVSILKRPEAGLDGTKTPTASDGVNVRPGMEYSSLSSSSEQVDVDGDIDDEEDEEEEDYSLSSSSGPRAKKAYIHGLLAGGGVYKSTPPTPGTRTPRTKILGDKGAEEEYEEGKGEEVKEDLLEKVEGKKKKKKTRTKRKTLVHSKSVPQLRVDTSLPAPSVVTTVVATGTLTGKKGKAKEKDKKFLASTAGEPITNKRERLQALARKLQDLFPEERKDLQTVIKRLEAEGASAGAAPKKRSLGRLDEDRRLDGRGGNRGRKMFIDDDYEEEEEEEEEEELDPCGRPPKKGDTLIHVFIDHSNILIGLLSHLKRFPPPREKQSRRPLPPIPASASSASTTTPASAFDAVHPSTARPLPIPGAGGKKVESSHPIPLPSFATANKGTSRSLPSGSVLSAYMGAREREKKEAISDGEESNKRSKAYNQEVVKVAKEGKVKKTPRHLWHAALALILERGRPVTRRVIVTSSPLYQPMDGIERLGYEVRVYLRVPDLGDGMDRERHREHERDRDSRPGSFRGNSGGKGPQLSPVKNISFNAWSAKGKQIGHVRRVSGSESGSGGGAGVGRSASAAITTNTDLHPFYMATHLNNHINAGNNGTANTGNSNTTAPARIKYREQGVDELLQLKLHQALAATDDVPEGSTIVLATGDGNVGQFNEDGFLGPVRTALRRGWRVELYAWEDGLSRSWRREFGEGSEWGRKGMFRVIGMEQFASGLVEAAGW